MANSTEQKMAELDAKLDDTAKKLGTPKWFVGAAALIAVIALASFVYHSVVVH